MEPVALDDVITLDRSGGEPLAVQLYRGLLAAILAGRLAAGGLPSSRRMAAALGVSRNTVNAAYDLLRAEGAITVLPGVAPQMRMPATTAAAQGPAADPARDLSARGARWAAPRQGTGAPAATGAKGTRMAPGQPDEALFPRDEWAMALRRAARQPLGPAFGYGDYAGLPALRAILARRLRADRGMSVDPGQILITPGSQAALSLLALTLADAGDRVLIEDPGYTGARRAFQGAGLTLHPLPVDAEGADPAGAPGARLIYLTPANHYPLGHRMSRARRAAVLLHAQSHDALIIEDDYDSEFLWHGREIAAMQGAAPDRVITLGTAAKALMPALRLGWIVAPAALAPRLAAAQRNLGCAANVHAQAALAAMMASGRYRAHLHRIARIYGERGRSFAAALRELPGVHAPDPSGGVQLAIHLPEGREAAALAALRAAGFAPAALSGFGLTGGPSGLVSGFAEATPPLIARFVQVLGQVLSAPPPGPPPAPR